MTIRQIDTPIGTLTLLAGPDGLRQVRWPGDVRPPGGDPPAGGPPAGEGNRVRDLIDAHLDAAVGQLAEYFAGHRREFDLELDPAGTEFQLRAWRELRKIPYGETISYGEQARRLGEPRASRAVGAANGRNPLSIVVPCHRVIGAHGKLTGFGGGLPAKAWLLDHERVTVWAS